VTSVGPVQFCATRHHPFFSFGWRQFDGRRPLTPTRYGCLDWFGLNWLTGVGLFDRLKTPSYGGRDTRWTISTPPPPTRWTFAFSDCSLDTPHRLRRTVDRLAFASDGRDCLPRCCRDCRYYNFALPVGRAGGLCRHRRRFLQQLKFRVCGRTWWTLWDMVGHFPFHRTAGGGSFWAGWFRIRFVRKPYLNTLVETGRVERDFAAYRALCYPQNGGAS